MSNFQQQQNKNHKAYKETGEYDLFKGNNYLIETGPKEDLMTDLLDEDFKTTALKMLKELKEHRTLRKQCVNSGAISNEGENLKETKKKFWS